MQAVPSCSVRAIRRFTVRPVLPRALAALGELAGNLRWSWHPETQDVFAAVDPDAVGVHRAATRSGCSARSGRARLDELAADEGFLRAARRGARRPERLPHRRPLVPAPGRRR